MSVMRKSDFIGLALLGFVIGCRYSAPVADFYAQKCYPVLSTVLSRVVSACPVSLEEVVVVGFIVAFLVVLLGSLFRRKGFFHWFGRTARVAMWLVVWFYLGWGNNYFRTPLYARMGIERASFDKAEFDRFLARYTNALNDVAGSAVPVDRSTLEDDVRAFYSEKVVGYGYAPIHHWQRVKDPLLNPLYSSVRVLGFMGPFFCETQLNRDLLENEYPFTLAHEMAHLAGVTSEAEANWWAYAYCRQASSSFVRYSGYLGLLPYVASNAAALLPEEEYDAWAHRLEPVVKADYAAARDYWDGKKVKVVDDLQRWVMDLYLKSNHVPEGARDYAGVVGMIMTMDKIK